MEKQKHPVFSKEWLKEMDARATKCRQEQGSPEVTTGYYAARKVKNEWRITNGRAWWDNPVVVREIHEYADGTVCAANYIENVQLFNRRNIENSGMRPVRPSELPDLLGIDRIVYFDHRETDEKGRALRIAHDLTKARETA